MPSIKKEAGPCTHYSSPCFTHIDSFVQDGKLEKLWEDNEKARNEFFLVLDESDDERPPAKYAETARAR